MIDAPYMTLDFNATVKDCPVYGLAEYFGVKDQGVDIDTPHQVCTVEFDLQPDVREFGIRSMSVLIKSVKCSVNWEVSTDDLLPEEKKKLISLGGTEYRSTIEGAIEVDSAKPMNGKDWAVDTQLTWQEDGQMIIDEVQIDFSDMSLIVSN